MDAPALPPRSAAHNHPPQQDVLAADSTYMPPPQRASIDHDITSPIHYSRDPHKLVAYLVPFPTPRLHNIPSERVPKRFLIYTPPPPPLKKPNEGEKETRVHKVQRKWEAEIRDAKTSTAKTMSWKGVKSKAIKGIDWGMGQTKTANLEFLNRIGGQAGDAPTHDAHSDDGRVEAEQTKKTVALSEMLLVHPSSMPGTPLQLREEFVNTMLRSKSKAQRDAIIATGLLPVTAAIDILATFIWPFGGLLEIDAVWAAASIRGAKTSRSVTKRLTSTSQSEEHEDTLRLEFVSSARLGVLERYLASECHARDAKVFAGVGVGGAPTESEVLEAIGWTPSEGGGEKRNWEDEQWEISEVKEDLKAVMHKGAREWDRWCKSFEKDPEKALKK